MGQALLYRALGLILCVGGILFGLITVGVFFGGAWPLVPTLLSWLCWCLGRASLKRGRRLSVPGAEEVRRRDRRSPVLYMRSIEDDAITARSLEWYSPSPSGGAHLLFVTEEQQLVKVLEEIGPVIAIGRPGEKLPELGAARKQVSDREWKTVVRNDMDDARLVKSVVRGDRVWSA
jgi:hypothetical protein